MDTIQGGALNFEVTATTRSLEEVLEETKRRIQGFTDSTVEGGEKMEIAFEQAAATIETAWSDIDTMADIHNAALDKLQKEYAQLGKAAGEAFMRGTSEGDKEYRNLSKRQEAIGQEIAKRQAIKQEINETADALAKEEEAYNKVAQKVEKAANTQTSLITQMRKTKYEIAEMEEAGLRGTEAYNKLVKESARLTNALRDANTQAKILSHDNAGLQGVISGVSGLTGAFSAAQGAVALFSGESENLQKIMLRVQSLMGITIGLQQVANTLNKDSAFRLVTINRLQEWWNTVKARAIVEQTTDTAATKLNTAAKVENAAATTTAAAAAAGNTAATATQTGAATAGTVANTGLAAAFRLVGVAIKSIPGIGWILAGVAALIALVKGLTKETREQKKAQEEMNKAVAEAAAKPLAAIQQLSVAYNKLGNDMKAKEKFVKDNQQAFDSLGVSVRDVTDAENLLINNKKAFVESQILKAKAMAATELGAKKYQEALEKTMSLEEPTNKYIGKGQFKGQQFTEAGLGLQFGRGRSAQQLMSEGLIEINPEWEKYNKKTEKAFNEANQLFEQAAQLTLKEQEILASLGQGLNNIAEGSIEALEANISKLRESYKAAGTDAERQEFAKQITEQEYLLEKIDLLQKTGSTKATKEKDPFIKALDERKKKYEEYYKWVNSGDEIVRKAAQTEFSGLLEEGATYLDYLKNQRAQLTSEIGDSEATARQTEELRKLNQAIATETKDTVLAQFEEELQNQLNGAQGIMQMLDIIEQRRKQLTGDGTELDTGKSEILDTAQQGVAEQAEQETRALLDNYTDYLQNKLDFEANYAENSRLLNENLAKAKTDSERKIAEEALKNLEADRLKYAKQTGSQEYDTLVEQYRTFQQQREDISAEYDAKIAEATRNGNEELANEIAAARDKKLSSVALEELQNTDAWTQLLGNLDDLTVKQLQNMITQIESKKATLGVELDAADLEVILRKVEEARDVVQTRNPFKALSSALKDYGNEANSTAKKADLNRIFEGAAGSIDLVKGGFDAVVGGLTEMGLAGDEITQGLLNDISALAGSASELAMGIASGNPLQIIQGSIGVITNAFKVFNKQDRDAARAIKKHAEEVTKLEKVYNDLERAVDKALGDSTYKNQQALIKNLKQQQYQIEQMRRAEAGKKKADKEKLNEYEAQYKELGNQIEDMITEISESITQTSAKGLAQQLADAIAGAFSEGFDSATVAEAIDKVTQDVMRNAVKNALKLQFLEAPLQAAVQQLQQSMGFNEKGEGAFDGLSAAEQQQFRNKVKNIASSYTEAMKMYDDLFTDLMDTTEEAADPMGTLSGAIKGASQESIDLLAGQTNAVRILQVENNEAIRQQLIHIASIDNKVGISNELLSDIYDALRTKETDPMRAQGITI